MAITPKNNDPKEPRLRDFSYVSMTNPPQLRQPEQVCGTRKNGASRLLNCTYILHTKLEKP